MNVQPKFGFDAGAHLGHDQLMQYLCDFCHEFLRAPELNGPTTHQIEVKVDSRVEKVLKDNMMEALYECAGVKEE